MEFLGTGLVSCLSPACSLHKVMVPEAPVDTQQTRLASRRAWGQLVPPQLSCGMRRSTSVHKWWGISCLPSGKMPFFYKFSSSSGGRM